MQKVAESHFLRAYNKTYLFFSVPELSCLHMLDHKRSLEQIKILRQLLFCLFDTNTLGKAVPMSTMF